MWISFPSLRDALLTVIRGGSIEFFRDGRM